MDYGLYVISVNASVNDYPEMWDNQILYLEIIPSDLELILQGGYTLVSVYKEIKIDAS